MVSYSLYGVIPSPVDDSVWGVSERFPGYLVRAAARQQSAGVVQDRRSSRCPEPGFDPRGVDIDSNGVVWTALAASSHLASFDRPQVQGPERPARRPTAASARKAGRSIRPTGPKLKGTDIPADFHYYNWVDQHNMLGARREHADRHRLELRLRCSRSNPQTQAVDRRCACRIRSASTRAAWTAASTIRTAAGRAAALCANYGTHFVWHIEGGKGTKGKIVKFQMRPDPLGSIDP